jgi:serine/threonine protein kinase
VEEKPPTAEVTRKSTLVASQTGEVKLVVTAQDQGCPACHNDTHRGSMTSWIFRREKHICNNTVTPAPIEPTIGDVSTGISHLFGDKYEVLGLVGQGGMGSVYKVKDRDRGAVFAIKVLRTELASEAGAVKRFEQEAIAAAQLTHPNLVAVYQHGVMEQSHGEPFLVMDYVEGESLASLIKREGYLPIKRALDIFIQVCDAVGHAHSKGLLHRDLKPSNVLISKSANGSDFVKLVDFGIAKVLPAADMQNASLTHTGELLGSPLYMSPEQCLGELVDVRSDIYSLGVLMYEVISGKPPFFAANPIKIIFKHLNEPPAAIRLPLSGHEIPALLEAMVLRCLEKKPADRYQSVTDLTADLALIQEGKQPIWKKKPASKAAFPAKKTAVAVALSFIAVSLSWFAIGSFNSARQSQTSALNTSSVPLPSVKNNVLIDSCTREIANHPKDPTWYFMRGTGYREMGDSQKALQDLSKALSLHPSNEKQVLRARAWTYNQMRDYAKSLADCNAALKIDPEYEEAYVSRSRAYCGLGNSQAALADADKAVLLNSSDSSTYWNRACCEAQLGQHHAALGDFSMALKLQPDEFNILIGRSRSYARVGQTRNAIDDLTAYIAAHPTEYQRLAERSDLYNKIGEHDKALADANEVIALAPADYVPGMISHAGASADLGHWDEAMQECLRAKKFGPRDPIVWKTIGDLWMKRKDYNEALKNYSTALECNPKFQEALESRAAAFEALGRKDFAREDLNKAQQL